MAQVRETTRPQPTMAKGQQVRLLVGCLGVADNADAEVVVPPGSLGRVVEVRETSEGEGPQGAWLYDVEFAREVRGEPDVVWCIYDAEDLHELEPVEG